MMRRTLRRRISHSLLNRFAMCGFLCLITPAVTVHAQGWSSDAMGGTLERTVTTVTASGAMAYHGTHSMRTMPTYIFKQVRTMTVQLEVQGTGMHVPSISQIQLVLRNKEAGSQFLTIIAPEDVDLAIMERWAAFTLDPSRLVADLGGLMEYGMSEIEVRVDYDLPPLADGDHVEMAFVLVPSYEASVQTYSERLSIRLREVTGLDDSPSSIYGVTPRTVPAIGYTVTPDSGDFYFDPPSLSIDTELLEFPYFAPQGSYGPEDASVRGEVSIDIPDAAHPIQTDTLLKVYARVNYVYGDVRMKTGMSPDYVPLQENAIVQPFASVRMTVRRLQGGSLVRPRLNLTFYDGTKADLEILNTTYLIDKDVVISFDEQGNVSRRYRNFVTDLTDFGYTVAENHREYMRIGITKTLGFLAGELTGGFGWLASQAAEEVVEYTVEKVSEYNRISPRSDGAFRELADAVSSASTSGHVDPTGAERVMDLSWVLMGDGSAQIENLGGTVDVIQERAGGGLTRMGAFSSVRVDTQKETISQAAALPPVVGHPDVVFELSPASEPALDTATPRIEIGIPFPGSEFVHARSLECRLNGRLISPRMRHFYDFEEYRQCASYQVPHAAPLPEGFNEIAVAILRDDGKRFEAQSTFMVDSIPRTPSELRTLNGRDRIVLRWRPNAESYVTGYRIFRSGEPDDAGLVVGETAQPVFADATANPATVYWYRVQAVGGAGKSSERSAGVQGQRNAAASLEAPPTPNELEMTALHNRVRIEFDDSAWNAAGWRLERGLASSGPFQPLLSGEMLAWSGHVDGSAVNGTTYYYRLTPEGMDGQSGAAIVSVGVTPAPQPVGVPTGLTGHRAGDEVYLRWDPPVAEDAPIAYRVYASRGGGDWNLAMTQPAPGVSCTPPIPGPGVYGFQVTAVAAGGVESGPSGIVLVQALLESPLVYVDQASASPTPPYDTWETAAREIQNAIDGAADGHTVLVKDGIYNTGGRAVYSNMLNRLVVDRALTVRSVNGPAHTVIEGALDPLDGTWGAEAVRAVYLVQGAVLDGFTVRNGATRGWGTEYDRINEQSGGGIWSESGASVWNCTIVSNYARYGGGVYQCQPIGGSGGVYNSRIMSNRAMDEGGGLLLSTAYNCMIAENRAFTGGGGFSVYLHNCTVTENRGYQRGGVAGGTIVNSIVYGNTNTMDSPNWGSGTMSVSMSYSCTVPMPGGSNPGNITDAPLFENVAGSDYRLAVNSPCIDGGTNLAWMAGTRDLSGNARIRFGRVDMGCFESTVMADADGDRIPDWWEKEYFGGPTTADANALAANRQNTLLQACIAGLNPHDANAFFDMRITSHGGAGFQVRWFSATGRRYRIDRSTDLTAPQGGFLPLQTDIAATPPENIYTDPEALDADGSLYRVTVTMD